MDAERAESQREMDECEEHSDNTDHMQGVEEEMATYAPIGFDVEEDETDAQFFLPQRPVRPNQNLIEAIKKNPLSEADLEELDKYNMKYRKTGVAIIFNHKKFYKDHLKERLGAERDGRVMKATLEGLGFEVRLHEDLTTTAIKDKLREAAREEYKDSGCLLIAVMTHGNGNGILASYNGTHYASNICEMFTGIRAPNLVGKPKIFLFQACRGPMVEESTLYFDSTDTQRSRALIIPSNADFLVAHSSIEGYRSFRNELFGSWFIQSLCKDLSKSAREKDFQSILTDTLRRVSYNRFSHTPKNQGTHQRQEMPIFSSTLTRRLFLCNTSS